MNSLPPPLRGQGVVETPKRWQGLSLEALEKLHISDALRRHSGNRKAAAGELGINPSTLYRKMKSLDIRLPHQPAQIALHSARCPCPKYAHCMLSWSCFNGTMYPATYCCWASSNSSERSLPSWRISCFFILMRVAIPIHEGRISPVFDVARQLLVIEIVDGSVTGQDEESMVGPESLSRPRSVVRFGVDVLICGAISRPLEAVLVSAGVTVIARRCGPVLDVLRAFMTDELNENAFLMPGCRGRHRRGISEKNREGVGR